jgi:hypothetical protein
MFYFPHHNETLAAFLDRIWDDRAGAPLPSAGWH